MNAATSGAATHPAADTVQQAAPVTPGGPPGTGAPPPAPPPAPAPSQADLMRAATSGAATSPAAQAVQQPAHAAPYVPSQADLMRAATSGAATHPAAQMIQQPAPAAPYVPSQADLMRAATSGAATHPAAQMVQQPAPYVPSQTDLMRAATSGAATHPAAQMIQQPAPAPPYVPSQADLMRAATSGAATHPAAGMFGTRQIGHVDDSADKKFVDPGSYVSDIAETGALGYDPTPAAPTVDSADRKFFDPNSYIQNVDETGALGYNPAPTGVDERSWLEILDQDFTEEERIQWGIDKGLYDEAGGQQLREGASVNPEDPAYFTPFGGGEPTTVPGAVPWGGGPAPGGGGVPPPGGGVPPPGGYGGVDVGGEGNVGTYDPFASNEYLQFGLGLADIEAAQRQLGQAEGFWDMAHDRKWDEIDRRIPGQYNQRGMLDSGLLGRAQGLAASDRLFEADVYDWQKENQMSALDRQAMGLEQGLAAARGQGLADQFGAGMMIGGPPNTQISTLPADKRGLDPLQALVGSTDGSYERASRDIAAKAFGADLPYDDPWWGQPAVPGSSITNWQVHSPELSR